MGRFLCNPLYITLFLPGIFATLGESGFGVVDSLYMLNRGITPVELGLLVGAFYFALTVTELPVAVAFDRSQAKGIIYAGLLLKITAYIFYATSNTPAGFFMAQVIAGVGVATLSGSIGAFVINHFEDKSYDNIGAVTSEWSMVSSAASLIGGGIGLYLFYTSDWMVWYFAALMTAASAIAFVRVPKLPKPSEVENFKFSKLVDDMILLLKRPLFIAAAMQDVALVGLVIFWQPRLSELGGDGLYYGFIVVTFSGAIASLVFRYYLPRIQQAFVFSIINAVFAGALVFTPTGYVFILFFALHIVASSILAAIVNTAFSESLEDRYRATAGSLVSLISGLMMLVLGPLAGLVAQTWTLATAGWITVAIFILIGLWAKINFRATVN